MTTDTAPGTEASREELREQRFVLYDVDWQTYRALADGLRSRHVRLSYDRGDLELMTPSPAHGNISRLLGRIVFMLAEELGTPLRSFGDMTCEREDVSRAVEPDECFYVESEPRIRHKTDIDLAADPPPDLAVEVDVSRSSRTRLPIYAALGVPEVWRFDGTTLSVHLLGADGRYAAVARSRSFPSVEIGKLVSFLRRRTDVDEVTLMRELREWLRGSLADPTR